MKRDIIKTIKINALVVAHVVHMEVRRCSGI